MGKIKVFGLALISLFSASLSAEWSEPVFLSELNDYQGGNVASGVGLTGDQNILFFTREQKDAQGNVSSRGIYEARRSPLYGTFSLIRFVNEIYNGYHTANPWVSPDGLRLYYEQLEYTSIGYQRYLKMARRDSIQSPWMVVRKLTECHQSFKESVDAAPRLSVDELTIYWVSNRSGNIQERKIYVADRPSTDVPFGNIREATEFNERGANVPFLSADGLTAYTNIYDGVGRVDLWKATRADTSEMFSNFELIEDIGQWGIVSSSPWVSPDQTTIYYFQRQGAPGDVNTTGIFMSSWIVNPYDVAVEKLLEAAELKQQALALLQAASASEQEALVALQEAIVDDIPDPVSGLELRKCRIEVMQSLIRELQAGLLLRQSVNILERVLDKLVPLVPEGEISYPEALPVPAEKSLVTRSDQVKKQPVSR